MEAPQAAELSRTALSFLEYFLVSKDLSGAVLAESEYNLLMNKTIHATFVLVNTLGCTYPDAVIEKEPESIDTFQKVLRSGNTLHILNNVVWVKSHNAGFSEPFADSIVACVKAGKKGAYGKYLVRTILVKPLSDPEILPLLRDDYFSLCSRLIEAVLLQHASPYNREMKKHLIFLPLSKPNMLPHFRV